MNARLEAIRAVGKHLKPPVESRLVHPSRTFAARVFSLRAMEQVLPKRAALNLRAAAEGREKLDLTFADAIAEAMLDWALKAGATHYTHWFQPLTGFPAEKHDSFLSFAPNGAPIEQFRGKELLRGEPDASSLPSGGLRATHSARGYTAWDPASPPFLWEGGDGLTLCIPSFFFSWKGQSLDHKIPLIRSDEKIQTAGLRLLKFCNIPAKRLFSTLGAEQEYFLIDRTLFSLRPDLVQGGRTVFGAPPAKGQELEDHYFGSVKDRVLSFMRAFEERAASIGIPVKTRHNEVAPAQHEVAPIFEKGTVAADHNLLLMEVMRQTARDHGLVCLFHEKPFARINGSGKHCNWSLATDTGINLLDPKESSLLFLTLLTAILHAVWEHAGLIRGSIASAGNDHRLGGAEAPPSILSVYLGEALEKILNQVLHQKSDEQTIRQIDLGLSHMPLWTSDGSDRNRTSFFAFTGNKFELRAVGASAHTAFPVTVLNAIVADSLHLILDEIQDEVKDKTNLPPEELFQAALPTLRKHLKEAEPILFSGNSYSQEWEEEAKTRGLPNIRQSFHAFSQLVEKRTLRAFQGILSEEELESRREILVEQYAKTVQIDAKLMIELFRTEILPAALRDQGMRAEALLSLRELSIPLDEKQTGALHHFSELTGQAIRAVEALEELLLQINEMGWEAKAKILSEIGVPKMEEARHFVDQLETLVDNALWPLPKYRELLFFI